MILKRGDNNSNVKVWQVFLNTLDYKLTADGDFGPATERATRSFQTANALKADGVVGDDTVEAAKAKNFAGFGDTPIAAPKPPVAVIKKLDAHNQTKLEKVHPKLRSRVSTLLAAAAAEGYTLKIVQGFRSFEEQDILFRQWRDGKDNDGDGRVDEPDERVTRAAGGQSNHNYGVAVDLAFVVDGKVSWDDKLYPKIGVWADNAGLAWGGDWKNKDLPHVELPKLPNWRVLLANYKRGGLQRIWDLIDDF